MPYTNSAGKSMDISWGGKYSFSQKNNAVGETLNGTADADNFSLGAYDTGVGGKGDDVYFIGDASASIVEKAGEGNDLAVVYDRYVLPANVENLLLDGDGAWFGGGNALDNIIMAKSTISSTTRVTLDGGAGNDILIGGGGKDTFAVHAGNGSDVVYNFNAKADSIALFEYGINNFSQVSSLIRQSGADTILQLSKTETLTLRDTSAASLTASNFLLQFDTSKLQMTFADEFTNAVSLNTGTAATKNETWKTYYFWNPATWVTSRFINSEQQVYTDADFKGTSTTKLGVNPFSVNDGVLSITAAPVTSAVQSFVGKQTYTSGLINTDGSFSQQYGYFETRAQMPEGKGLWPAFWLLPTDHSWPPEIDVFEQLGRDPDTIYMSSHTPGAAMAQGKYHLDTGVMHTYGVDWGKDNIVWYIDGTEVYRTATPDSMRKEMYVLLNLAVGDGWAGPADASTGTAQMKIDYVHVYQNADTVSKTVNGVQTLFTPSSATTTPVAKAEATIPVAATPVATTPIVATPVVTAPVVTTPVVSTPAAVTTPVTTPLATGTPPVINGTDKADRLVSLGVDGTVIYGGAGDDYIVAHGTNNKLVGGTGNDTYVIDNVTQIIVEDAAGGDKDMISTSVSYTMAANVELLVMTGKDDLYAYGNDQNNSITGNDGNNLLRGYGGDDILDGRGGADRMEGGTGNDTYYVDHSGDVVVELPGEGWDTVWSSISYTLTANVEGLNLSGSGNLEGNGNDLNNVINGNSGNNILRGYAGDDTIDGKAGADRMEGGLGDDTYMVDNIGDVVIELPNQGTDRVYSTVSYTLGANVEQLYLQGGSAINATGNSADNVLSGNSGNNVITGGKGNDYMTGGPGSDTFVFNTGDGRDWVGDFDVKNDVLKLVGVNPSTLKISQSGYDTVVSYGTAGDTVTLVGVWSGDPLLKSHILFA